MLRRIGIPKNENFEPLENPGRVSGFQSPAEDYAIERLNIMNKLVKDPTNTFYFIADDDSMSFYSIRKGSLLVVDRSIIPSNGMRVIIFNEGKWLVRQLVKHGRKVTLTTGAENEELIDITENGALIWGVVTWSCCPQLEVKKHVRAR
jgi:DNA polymerase V